MLACLDDSDSATCGRHGPGHVVGVGGGDLGSNGLRCNDNELTHNPFRFLISCIPPTYMLAVCGRAGRKGQWPSVKRGTAALILLTVRCSKFSSLLVPSFKNNL